MALTDKLIAIGDAIRQKNGGVEPIPLGDMPQAIIDIINSPKVQKMDGFLRSVVFDVESSLETSAVIEKEV